jgi:hypothetical protein
MLGRSSHALPSRSLGKSLRCATRPTFGMVAGFTHREPTPQAMTCATYATRSVFPASVLPNSTCCVSGCIRARSRLQPQKGFARVVPFVGCSESAGVVTVGEYYFEAGQAFTATNVVCDGI